MTCFESPPTSASRRSRRGAAIALAAACLMSGVLPAGDARAQNAVLITPDACDDPAAVFDYRWAKEKFGADSLFMMLQDGSIHHFAGPSRDFDDFRHVYVAAHGGADSIGGIGYADFVRAFKAGHDAAPRSVVFAVCGAGKGPDSLLKMLNTAYGDDIFRLAGGVTGCALTGNGSQDLALADYRIYVTRSDDARYNRIVDNITRKWSGPYPSSASSYRAFCRSRLQPFDAGALRDFVGVVHREFSQQAVDPLDSTNYLELVSLNKGGDPLALCGANPEGAGPVPCP